MRYHGAARRRRDEADHLDVAALERLAVVPHRAHRVVHDADLDRVADQRRQVLGGGCGMTTAVRSAENAPSAGGAIRKIVSTGSSSSQAVRVDAVVVAVVVDRGRPALVACTRSGARVRRPCPCSACAAQARPTLHSAQPDEHAPGERQPVAHARLDVVLVARRTATAAGSPRRRGRAAPPGRPSHSSHDPTATALSTATDEGERGEPERRTPRPNVPACMAISFTSTVGPDHHERQPRGERELGQARGHERVGLRADRQHHREAGEERAPTRTRWPADGATATCAGTIDVERGGGQPADHQEPAGLQEVVRHRRPERLVRLAARSCCGRRAAPHPAPGRTAPRASPPRTAVTSDGEEPGEHHLRAAGERDRVATSTTGLIAGADSRNASAAAASPRAPPAPRRPAPTRTRSRAARRPAHAATGTASAGVASAPPWPRTPAARTPRWPRTAPHRAPGTAAPARRWPRRWSRTSAARGDRRRPRRSSAGR